MEKVKCEFEWIDLVHIKDKLVFRKIHEESQLRISKESNNDVNVEFYEREIKQSQKLIDEIERYINEE